MRRRLPAGAARKSLLSHLAQRCGLLGSAEFQAAQKSVVAMNAGSLGRYDLAMLRLRGRIISVQPADREDSAVLAVFERLATAAKWDEAARAIDVYYSAQPAADGRWALVRLKIRQAVYDEDQRLAARRTLGGGLSAAIRAALTDAIAILKDGSESNRAVGIDLTGSLISRYSGLGRGDLAEAVLAAVADPEQHSDYDNAPDVFDAVNMS